MIMKCPVITFLLFLALTCLGGAELVLAQDNFEIRGLEIKGNHTLSESLLRAQMSIYAVGGFRKSILGKEPSLYNADIVAGDLKRLVRLYQREGFLYARAEIANIESDTRKRTVRLTIRITEGDSIAVAHTDFTLSASQDTAAAAIDSLWTRSLPEFKAVPGSRFRDEDIEADRSILSTALKNIGYPYVSVEPAISVDEKNRTAAIVWRIEHGPYCTFGPITIQGNRHTKTELIRDALTMKSGDTFSRKSLDESQRQVYDLALFHVVTVSAALQSDRETIIPVVVTVKEAPRVTTKLGLGFGREDKFRTYSDSHILGFFGGARRLQLYLKHSAIEPYHISLKFTQPGFITRRTSLEINPFILRQEEPAYTEYRYGGNTSLLHTVTKNLFGSITYTFERVNVEINSLAGIEFTAADIPVSLYNKSSIQAGLTFDNSTPLFSPHHGVYIASLFKISGLGLGSDFHFTRFLTDLRRYQPLWGMVLAGRVKLGGIKSTDVHGFIPVEDRFYAGGSSSVRGWSRATLGPQIDGVPTGGNSLLEGSVEFRYPIIGILSGALFTDFGNVWLDSYSYHINDLSYASGFGIRVGTPIGPARLDLAWPVMGDTGPVQLNISVGEAF